MNNPTWKSFESTTELDQALAAHVALLLEHAINTRGNAVLVVSGGSTPKPFFNLLSQYSLPWQKVTVTLADERWVTPDDADSNEKLVRENLLINDASSATFLSLTTSAEGPAEGEADIDKRLSQLGTFDVLILGMGGDGHTASLFPQAPTLAQALDLDSGKNCLAMNPVTAPNLRMTLTLPRLLNSKQIIVHITGDSKKTVLDNALSATQGNRLPIAYVALQEITPVTIFWSP